MTDDLVVLLHFEQAMIAAERPFDPAISAKGDIRYYDLEQLLGSADVELVVAEADGAIIGCGYARIEASKAFLRHERHSYLGFMYVLPEYRGKGVNKAVLDALEKWSVSHGINVMQLEVYSQNSPAIRAYEKAGFNSTVIEMRKNMVSGK